MDGIDWYSIPQKRHIRTTKYSMGNQMRHILGIDFLDETTVVAGNSTGSLFIVPMTMTRDPYQLVFNEYTAGMVTSLQHFLYNR